MKTIHHGASALVAAACGLWCVAAAAQAVANGALEIKRPAPDGSDTLEYSTQLGEVAPALAPGHVARYRVTYTNSSTTTANRTATVVSITNQSTGSCSTSVDWRIGFGGVACTTTLVLGPGQTGEHCTRALPSPVTICNATCAPALTSYEGGAIVGAANVSTCAALAISARTYHTTGAADTAVAAATDAKVVRINASNAGD